jgi:acyl-CoA dehydrogenase
MQLDVAALVEHARCSDPLAWRQMQELLEQLSGHAARTDSAGGFAKELWSQVPIGFLNRLNLPGDYGGGVFTSTALRRVIFFERIGRVCPGQAIGLPGPGLSTPPVLFMGTEQQKRDYFRRFLCSERPVWGAFAMTEPQSGSDAAAVRTIASPTGDGYRISGRKCFINGGGRAEVLVVFANIAPEKGRFGIRAFVVEKDCPGFKVERCEEMLGLRACQLAALSFNDCCVPREAMLGHTGVRGPRIDGFTAAQYAWDYMRPVLAAVINGASWGILDYADTLLQAGALQVSPGTSASGLSQLAYLRARLQSARLQALRAAWKYDSGRSATLDASAAKVCASSAATEISSTLGRMFPLHSLTGGDPIEKFHRDAKAFDILEGTGDMQRLMIARGFDKALLADSRQ